MGEFGFQISEKDGRPKTEDGRPRTEDRRRKTDDRGSFFDFGIELLYCKANE